MTAADIKPSTRFFGLFVGESSSGKDCAISSFPKPMLILDSDLRKGILAARKWMPEEEFKQIEIKQFPPTKNFGEFDKELLSVQSLITRGACPYKTIVINSMTSLSRIIMTDAFEFMAGNTIGPKGGYQLRLSSPGDYKFEKAAFFTVFDYLRSFPINVIIVGHTVPRYEQVGDNQYAQTVQVGTRLSLTERLANDLLLYFDEAYEFYKSSDGRNYYVAFHSQIARTCFDTLPHGRLDITNQNFYQKWLSFVNGSQPKP